MTSPTQKDAWNSLYRTQPRQWKGAIKNTIPFPFAKGDIVLDIGCGNGKASAALIRSGFDVIGIDVSDVAADACRKMHGDKMKVICASADSIPIYNAAADGIVMIHILEHLDDNELRASVKEADRVLRPGGKIFVRVFHTDDMRSDSGKRIDERTVVRGNGIRYRYFDERSLRETFGMFREVSMERIDETTKFKEIRSRIEAVFEKPA